MALADFGSRVKPVGVLYVDVYPFCRMPETGEIRFLLFKRRDDVPLPGTWQAVSGKIAEGESIRAAFWRQVRKKTSCEPLGMFKLDMVNTFYDAFYDTVMMVPGAACELPHDAPVALDESLHVDLCWVPLAEYLEWPGQLQAMAWVAQAAQTDHGGPLRALPDA